MGNPYEILGISKNSSMEEVKKVYRELAKKYHPDFFKEQSDKEYYQKKMSEINNAYEKIMNSFYTGSTKAETNKSNYESRKTEYKEKNSSKSNYNYNYSYTNTDSSSKSEVNGKDMNPYKRFVEIRRDISENKFVEAQKKLQSISVKTPEWYFLSGILSKKRGFNDSAYTNLKKARDLNPKNTEYEIEYTNFLNENEIYKKMKSQTSNYLIPIAVCAFSACAGCNICCRM